MSIIRSRKERTLDNPDKQDIYIVHVHVYTTQHTHVHVYSIQVKQSRNMWMPILDNWVGGSFTDGQVFMTYLTLYFFVPRCG